MQAHEEPGGGMDSLDLVELVFRIEEALEDSRKFGGNDEPEDDDTLAILVRKLGPKKPRGSSGATVPLR